MRLKNILIVVEDVERSKRFYRELFGLQVITDFGENVIMSEGLVLQERKSWEKLVNHGSTLGSFDSELFFVENNLDDFLEKLKSTDIEYEMMGEPSVNFLNKRTLRMYDPDHHIIEIGER